MKSTSRTIVKTSLITTFVIGLAIIIWPQTVSAAFDINQGIVGNLSEKCRLTGDCGWCDFIDLMAILQRVILSIFGGVALIMLIWAGQGIIMAGGNQEKVSASKKLITSTLFGVLIILIGYFLINVLVNVLINDPGKTGAKLFSDKNISDWFIAGCVVTNPADPAYCERKPDGTPCKATGPSDNYVCYKETCNNVTCESLKKINTTKDYGCFTKCETPYQEAGLEYCSDSKICCFKPNP
jgi:hypothetical protein